MSLQRSVEVSNNSYLYRPMLPTSLVLSPSFPAPELLFENTIGLQIVKIEEFLEEFFHTLLRYWRVN
jgi:hypothetical protein